MNSPSTYAHRTMLIMTLGLTLVAMSNAWSDDNTPSQGQDNNTPSANTNSELNQKGQKLITSCDEGCHESYRPEQFSAKRWKNILKKMLPLATALTDEDKQILTDYIMQNAKQKKAKPTPEQTESN